MPVVSLFVSSTFRDFHAERDLLLGSIRAELDERVGQFGCRVEVIDLRWGLGLDGVDEALVQDRTLSVCLAEIDRARPLFVGLLGDRYGWVPPGERVDRVTVEAGWVGGVADGWSVTALEFEHGAFRHEGERPVFFVRDLVGSPPPGWVDEDRRAVDGLRARVVGDVRALVHTYQARADGARVTELVDFERVVLATLGPLVEARAQTLAAGESDPIAVAERLFVEARTTVVGRADELELLREAMVARRSVCLFGASGVGKSALWCAARAIAAAPRAASLVVGVAPGTSGVADVIGRFAAQLGLVAPDVDADELVTWWRSALSGTGEVLLAVDGLDGLDADAADLRWLSGIPGSVQLLVSTTDARHAELLARQGVLSVPVGGLDERGVAAMLAQLAGELRRTLPAGVVSLLAQQPRSPLWVQLAFADLTGLDESDFAQVAEAADVARLLAVAAGELPDNEAGLVAALCDRVDAANGGAVAPIVTLLAGSRSGLSPLDLAELTGLDPVVIARVRRGFAGLIVARGAGGRLGFTHGLVRQATANRYPADTGSVHERLATHHAVRASNDDVAAGDALWHTLLAGNRAARLLDDLLRGIQPFSDEAEGMARVLTLATRHDPTAMLASVAASDLTCGSVNFLGWYLEQRTLQRVDTDVCGQLAAAVLDIAARLAGADPNNAQAQRDLTVSLDNVASVAMQRGDLDSAADVWQRATQVAMRFPLGHHIGAELRPFFAGRLEAVAQQLEAQDHDLAQRCLDAAARLRGTA